MNDKLFYWEVKWNRNGPHHAACAGPGSADWVTGTGVRSSTGGGGNGGSACLGGGLAKGQLGFCCAPDFLQTHLSVASVFEWLYGEIAFIVLG